MRIIKFIMIGIGLSDALAQAAPRGRELEEYMLGKAVGFCLVVRCQVFRGVVLTVSPEPNEPITVSVDEALFGMIDIPGAVKLPYHDDPRNGDKGAYLAAAWARANVTRNSSVTVVLALEKGFGVFPGEPSIVTSDERDAVIIRSLADQARRLGESPELVSDRVASLSRDPSPALAGYLFTYLAFGKASYPRELWATLLSELVGSLVADQGLAAGFLVAQYQSLQPPTQVIVIAHLTEFAQRPDLEVAKAAFHGLAEIASLDHSVPAMIPQAAMAGLEDAYRDRVKKGSMPRDHSLEQGLGIRYK
jgi:hypothetical protein